MHNPAKTEDMKRFLYPVLMALFYFCPYFVHGQAKHVPRQYTCHFLSGKIDIDGRLDEKAWQKAAWSAPFVDIATGAGVPEPVGTRFKILWDDHYCYIAACLMEPDIRGSLTKRDAIIYQDNDFEVFMDPDGDGLNYYEIEINALGTVLDLFLSRPYNKGGKAGLSWNAAGLRSAVALYGTLNHPADTDSRWTVEMAVPWAALKQKPPENNAVWRMNFSRVEWPAGLKTPEKKEALAKKQHPEANWVWSPQGVVNMHVPSQWGYVRFVKMPGELPVPRIWVWSQAHRNWSDRKWQETLKKLSQAGITGLLLSADTATLHKIAVMAQCFGVQVHAWFVTMNNPKAPAGWLSVNAQGKSLAQQKAYVNYYKFMCPGLPAVRHYLHDKMNELMAVKGLAGIHFDYIRYVDVILPKKLQPKYHLKQKDIMPQFDYGYHPYMRQLYRKKYGTDPLKLPDPLHDTSWLAFRMKVLDTTVIQLRNQIHKAGFMTSAAVFPTPALSRRMVRQDWDSWHLDYYFPMAYHNFYGKKYAWLKKVSATDVKAVGPESKVFTGLFLPALKKGGRLTRAMKASVKGGADGIALFDLRVLDDHLLRQVARFSRQWP